MRAMRSSVRRAGRSRGVAALGLAAASLAAPVRAAPTSSDAPVVGSPPQNIIGGTPTTVDQYPSVVALSVGGYLCTGTLVAPRWVLTAAHCLDPAGLGLASQDAVTQSTQVHFHTVDLTNSAGTTVGASATFTHPLHNLSQLELHDVGLIELASPVTSATTPINLRAALAQIGTELTIVGFGQSATGRQGPSGVEYELRNKPTVSCNNVSFGSDDDDLCYTELDGHGICFGDSGGPAFVTSGGRQVVVAVTSVGDPLCTSYGASNRVDVEREFLVEHAPELAQCTGDANCPGTQICFAHACVAAPFSPGGLGATCGVAGDCDTAMCALHSGEHRCSQVCSPATGNACPDGFDCVLSVERGGGECWPSGGGCCSAGGGGAPGAAVLGLGVIGMLRRRRRS